MKKKIKLPSEKSNILREKKDGTLEGGFASIKGGFSPLLSDNDHCTNTSDCTHSTNTPTCTNTKTCLV